MSNADQARLSERHRAAQAKLQAVVAADVARVFPLMDFNNLDKTFGGYVDAMSQVINARRTVSASLSSTYYQQVRKAADIDGVFTPILSAIADPDQLFTSLLVTGPIHIKNSIAQGRDVFAARDAALAATAKAAQRHVINGGRGTVLSSVRRDDRSVGWARLTDGQPCAFCALLASRGPAYKSEATSKFKSHDGCGCTAVPVFDFNAPWPGRAEEFRRAYDESISGKFPGGDGNNQAVRAWRKEYDKTFLGIKPASATSTSISNAATKAVAATRAAQAPAPHVVSRAAKPADYFDEDRLYNAIPETPRADGTMAKDFAKSTGGSHPENIQQKNLMREQGFLGKPRIVDADEYDRIVANGARPIYRGMGGETADEIDGYFSTLIDGDEPFVGRGIYGDGSYFASERDVAETFAKQDRNGIAYKTPGKVADAVLDPSAKVISLPDLLEKQREVRKELQTRGEFLNQDIEDNDGLFATIQGYDAVYVDDPWIGFNDDGSPRTGRGRYYNVLNRTALVIKKMP